MIKVIITFVLIPVIAFFALGYTFGYVIYPGEMGVRQVTFGPAIGFSKKGLVAGYHWSIPVYSVIHRVPQTIQSLDLNRNSNSAVEIQTTDGSSVDLDVVVLYRFFNESNDQHGGPADLIRSFGPDWHSWPDRIKTLAVNEL